MSIRNQVEDFCAVWPFAASGGFGTETNMATAILNVTNGDSQAILDTVTYLLTNTKKKFHKFDPVIHIVTEASKGK